MKIKLYLVIFILLLHMHDLHASTRNTKDSINNHSSFKRNLLSISLSDVLLKRFAVEYEVLADEKGKLAVSTNFLYDFEPKVFELYHAYTYWWLGMKVEYFFLGQKKFRFYAGFELKLISKSSTFASAIDEKAEDLPSKLNPYIIYWMGFRYDLTSHFTLSLNTGLSVQKSDSGLVGFDGLLIGNLGIGYKF